MNDKISRRSKTIWNGPLSSVVSIIFLAIMPVLPVAAHADQPGNLDPLVIKLEAAKHLSSVSEDLADKRVVYVGEIHTAYEDHLVQLELLRLLHQQDPDLAIGVEWFQARFQNYLDDYIQKRISEKEFLHKTEYYSRWRFDYRLYRPIMQFAREHGIPVLALNASTEVIRAISSGGIDNLPAELKAQLPTSYDFTDSIYEEKLKAIYDIHPQRSRDFRWFHEAQLTWDETMADNIVSYLKDNPGQRMIVYAGRGHVSHRHGIPSRVQRRMEVSDATVITLKDGNLDPGMADYIVVAEEVLLPTQGKLGVLLETVDKGVRVSGFTDGSTAKEAGMKVGDVITTVDDQPVATFSDLKYSILDKSPGDRIEMTLQRKQLILGIREVTLDMQLGKPSAVTH